MAQSVVRKRDTHGNRRRKAPPGKAARRGGGRSSGGVGKAVQKVTPSPSKVGMSALARKAAGKAVRTVASKTLEAGARAVRATAERTAEGGKEIVAAGITRKLPIQRSVDVAVPLPVAWEEWMEFDFLPEGVHRIERIERHGSELSGVTAGTRKSEWLAEVLDERKQQSFAWRSYEGSDCAGLVTFHRLSDRLTRIELNLDVVPSNPVETMSLTTHLADRRAEADLRRFKARLELINPDLYEDGAGPATSESSDDDAETD
jgi:uncharacterized membrane protein